MGFREKVASLISPRETASFGFYTSSHTLAENNKVVIDSQTPISKKTTPTIRRIKKEELEAAYMFEPNMFNAVNKTAQLIMAAGYKLLGDSKSVTFFEGFFNKIGTRGGELEWEELLASIYRNQMIYGDAWTELIPAKRDSGKIVDLDLVDPKKMDYAKDSSNKIALDKYGDPFGYIETLPFEYVVESKYKPPNSVTLQSNQIFFPPERVAHFKLYTTGDRFYGIGLVEPSYQSIKRKLSMEEALANALNRVGFPTRRIEWGDLNHEPTEEQVQRSVEEIRAMDYKGVIGHPYWVKLHLDEAKHPEKLQEQLKYFTDQIVTGSGLPRALATGMGEATNRATLNRQESLAKLTLKDIVRRTTRVIYKKIIQPVAESNGVNPVRITWGEIAIEELDGKAKRLSAYVKAGLLTPDKRIEDLIRKTEDLPESGISETRGSGTRAKKPDVK